MVRKYGLLICITLIIGIHPLFAYAQSSPSRLDITVSPISLDLTAPPGGEIHDKIRVHNNTNALMHLAVNVKKITPTNQGIGFELAEPGPADDFVSWIHIDNPHFDVPAQEWAYISFTVNIPQAAALGYYPVFVINEDASAPQQQENAVLSGGVAVITSLTVLSPNAHVEAQLIDFKALSRISEWLPVDFSVGIKNTGNIHVRPRGNIFISSQDHSDIGILEINPGIETILPGGSRSFTAQWNDSFITREKNDQGKYHFVIHWDSLTHMRIGKYTARLFLVYDAGQKDVTLEAVTSFWVFPWKTLLIVIGCIVVVVGSLWLLVRWYIRRVVAKRYGNV